MEKITKQGKGEFKGGTTTCQTEPITLRWMSQRGKRARRNVHNHELSATLLWPHKVFSHSWTIKSCTLLLFFTTWPLFFVLSHIVCIYIYIYHHLCKLFSVVKWCYCWSERVLRISVFFSFTHFVFFLISSTSCLMWSSMNSIFSFLRACAFCSRTMRSTSTALSTSGKLSTTTTDEPDWFSGDRSSILLPRAFREPKRERGRDLNHCAGHTIKTAQQSGEYHLLSNT